MRLTPLLLLPLMLTGCRAHHTWFRGVDRSLYVVELEELPPAEIAAQAADFVADQRARVAPTALASTQLTTDGLQGRAEWSPDGSRIVFQSVRSGGLASNPWEQTWLMDADGANQRRITAGVGKTHGAVVVPGTDDFVIAYGSTQHLGTTPPRDVPAVGDSADHEMELVRQNLSRGTVETLAGGPGFDGEPHFCGDGSAFAFTSARTGDLEVYVQPVDGAPTQLTRREGPDESPRMAPDCRSVVWVSRRGGGSELTLLVLDGSPPRTLLAAAASVHTPDFTPDGTRLVFSSDLAGPGGSLDLYSVAIDGTDLRRITRTEGSERSPRVSPDGTRLLYSDDASGSPQLHTAPFEPALGQPFAMSPAGKTP